MKSLATWLNLYAQSHQNPTNKRIHWICVPAIVFSLFGLLWSIPSAFPIPQLNWATLALGLACLYYLRLSLKLFWGMLLFSLALTLVMIGLAQQTAYLWQICATLFVLAWIGQFVGHKIEGKKPSFFEDIQFLLIGPAWCLSFLYDRWGIGYDQPARP